MKGYIFDLDGTLIDSQWVWRDSTIEIFEELHLENPLDVYKDIRSFSLEEAGYYIIERFSLSLSYEELSEMIIENVKQKYDQQVKAKEGVIEKLKSFHQQGIKMIIATASEHELIEICLKRLGIDQFMEYIITTSQYQTNKKTEAKIYDKACELLALNKEDVLVFEDALHAIETLKKHNYQVCGIYDEDNVDHQGRIKSLVDYYILDWPSF